MPLPTRGQPPQIITSRNEKVTVMSKYLSARYPPDPEMYATAHEERLGTNTLIRDNGVTDHAEQLSFKPLAYAGTAAMAFLFVTQPRLLSNTSFVYCSSRHIHISLAPQDGVYPCHFWCAIPRNKKWESVLIVSLLTMMTRVDWVYAFEVLGHGGEGTFYGPVSKRPFTPISVVLLRPVITAATTSIATGNALAC
ncbi:uncharacterized protein Z518_09073 [Rhinocladiella mackenziei CBS 650.93]|uniref:Rhinocladiella mackenziei CBS 650.93 unplaced genomic scaffold supercont1.7, whole genome shotgun sequence n=1 Tax=Rhinocladiella mackenziei CBS 650.93 TaxID=1442369 RepID=A0A0D2GSJ3_9EURO|nr:uncharacterized protein Z518_09073 [Rhinocladiella mackenziei CBS 650.93]KIX01348.1 hypothetical protein Z518_09073 [Rhinocladiella mackenziei CBS 650.93]